VIIKRAIFATRSRIHHSLKVTHSLTHPPTHSVVHSLYFFKSTDAHSVVTHTIHTHSQLTHSQLTHSSLTHSSLTHLQFRSRALTHSLTHSLTVLRIDPSFLLSLCRVCRVMLCRVESVRVAVVVVVVVVVRCLLPAACCLLLLCGCWFVDPRWWWWWWWWCGRSFFPSFLPSFIRLSYGVVLLSSTDCDGTAASVTVCDVSRVRSLVMRHSHTHARDGVNGITRGETRST